MTVFVSTRVGLDWIECDGIRFLFISTTESGFCLGDNILHGLGLPTWTDEKTQTGLHVTVLVGLALIAIGYIGAKRNFGVVQPHLASRLPTLVLILLFLSPALAAGVLAISIAFLDGLSTWEQIWRAFLN